MAELELVTVKTRILTPNDDIVKALEEYAKDKIGPNDVVSVAESVVAITQGRLIRPEELNPGFWACLLSRFFPTKGSLSNPAGMQAAMNLEGQWRIVGAFFIAMLCKLVGQKGVFYKLAGQQAPLIDDVTGTMPPFDKHIVYGPSDPKGVAEAIKKRFGCFGAAVADVNDLKRALIVGATDGIDQAKLREILIDNPFGNASQKTPIVIIKNYAAAQAKAQTTAQASSV
jgi:hypothetical protein